MVLEYYVGDKGININFVVSGLPNALVGATVNFVMVRKGYQVAYKTFACTIDSDVNGTCHYTFADGELADADTFEYFLDVTWTAGFKRIPGTQEILVKKKVV